MVKYDFVKELDKIKNKIIFTDDYIIYNGIKFIKEEK